MPYSHGLALGRSRSYVAALLEGDAEQLAECRLGSVRTDAANEVAVQHGRMTVEDQAERGRPTRRRGDDLSIGVGSSGVGFDHTDIFPAERDEQRSTRPATDRPIRSPSSISIR